MRQFQVRVAGERVTMQVLLRDAAPHDVPDRLRAAIVRELEDAGAAAPDVAVEPVAGIVRERGPGARLKLVRSDG